MLGSATASTRFGSGQNPWSLVGFEYVRRTQQNSRAAVVSARSCHHTNMSHISLTITDVTLISKVVIKSECRRHHHDHDHDHDQIPWIAHAQIAQEEPVSSPTVHRESKAREVERGVPHGDCL